MIALSAAIALVGLAAVLAARNVALRWLAVVHGHKRADDVEALRVEVAAALERHMDVLGEHAKRFEAIEATSDDALSKVKALSTKAAFGGRVR